MDIVQSPEAPPPPHHLSPSHRIHIERLLGLVATLLSGRPCFSSLVRGNVNPFKANLVAMQCIWSKKNAAKRSRQHARIQQRGGRTHNIPQRTDTHIFIEGGTHPQCNPTNGHTYFHRGGDAPTMLPKERTHIFSQGGGDRGHTHNVTQRTDTHL